jgi:Histone H1-like protein Hc1
MNEFIDLKGIVNALSEDAAKAADGNKAAQTRLRVGMQKVKSQAQAVRVAVEVLRGKAD